MSHARRILRAIAALVASLSVSLHAAAQSSGSAVGRWIEVSPRVTLVSARIVKAESRQEFALDAQLLGGPLAGCVIGVLRERPSATPVLQSIWALEYVLIGRYLRAPDGRTHVEALVALDLRSHGVDLLAVAGSFHGVLGEEIARGLESQPTQAVELASVVETGMCPGGLLDLEATALDAGRAFGVGLRRRAIFEACDAFASEVAEMPTASTTAARGGVFRARMSLL